jgi:hypothetical protein
MKRLSRRNCSDGLEVDVEMSRGCVERTVNVFLVFPYSLTKVTARIVDRAVALVLNKLYLIHRD